LFSAAVVALEVAKAVSHALRGSAISTSLLGSLWFGPTLLLLELLRLELHSLHWWWWLAGRIVHMLTHLRHLLHDHLILLFEKTQLVVSGILPR
jgi:hypothetical protein